MNEKEFQSFEAELKRLRPANPPEQLMTRLSAARPEATAPAWLRPASHGQAEWLRGLRWWLASSVAMAVLMLAMILWRQHVPRPAAPIPQWSTLGLKPALQADEVQIDQRLVAAFEAVARLPNGESVRFRCREWIDEVVVRDSAQGVVIQQSTPRFEAVPVRFETY